MPTPLLRPSPPAGKSSRPPTVTLALYPIHFVSWIHSASILIISIISTTSNAFPLNFPTLRLPNRNSHLDRCRLDDPLGRRCLLATAKESGASLNLGFHIRGKRRRHALCVIRQKCRTPDDRPPSPTTIPLIRPRFV